jgi:hypothetical protein
MADPYDIGYGKPPKASQWQKGQSGNPKGRPKTRADHLRDAAMILTQPVTARTPERKTISLNAIEAAYLAQCRKGLKGNVPALIHAIKLMLEVQPVIAHHEAENHRKREDIYARLEKMGVMVNRDRDPVGD